MAAVDGGSHWRMIFSGSRFNTGNTILRRFGPGPDPDLQECLQVRICIRSIHRIVYIDADGLNLGSCDFLTGILWQSRMAFSLTRDRVGCFFELQRILSSVGIPWEMIGQIATSIFRYASGLYAPEQGPSVIQITADLTLIFTEEMHLPPQQDGERMDESLASVDDLPPMESARNLRELPVCGQNLNLGNCPICLDDLSSSTARDLETRKLLSETPCFHVFHDSCIRRWLDTNPTCPLCRCIIG